MATISPTTHARIPRRPIGAAAVLAAAALFAGCGSSATQSATTSTVAQHTVASQRHSSAHARHTRSGDTKSKGATAVRSTSSKKHPGAVAHHSTAATPPAVHAKQPVISAGAVTSSLSGTGNQAIGNLSEKTTVVLEWSTATPPIQIFNPHGFLLVNSSAATGRVRLARGEYKGLRVAAKGHWTIHVRAS